MTIPAPDPVSAADSTVALALGLALAMVAPLLLVGLAILNTGLGRARSAAQALLGSLLVVAVSVLAFLVLGSSLAGVAGAGVAGGSSSRVLWIAGKPWDWLGAGALPMRAWTGTNGIAMGSLRPMLLGLFSMMGAALAALIPWGSGSDRWRISSACLASVGIAGWLYPLPAHWVWGGGWLARLGGNFGLGAGFLDCGGAATVHVLGGVCALCVVWIAGPRRGKFPKPGISTAIPGHHIVYALLGCLLALAGGMAWNCCAALLMVGLPLQAIPVVATNTLVSASAAVLASFLVTRARFGKPDASLCANGWVAGLVASSACAALISPGQAIALGCVAGILTPLTVEILELGISIDDPSGAITVHGVVGIWGLLAVGLFSPAPGQLLAQMVGIATLLGLMLPMTYLLFWILNKWARFRVDADGERLGMDLHELGSGAYPEFVIHRDDFQR